MNASKSGEEGDAVVGQIERDDGSQGGEACRPRPERGESHETEGK